MPQADAQAHWSARLHDVAGRARIPGAVLGIWQDGRETLVAHGVLNAATQVQTTAGSLFQVGSITKMWTATMICQLAGEGRVSLDSTVADVLPGVRLGTGDASGEVTLRHLLTHTSGIDGDIFTDTGRGGDCLERYAAELAGAAQTFPPGSAYSYCNSGFVLLGRVIEVLDGREWDASLRARLVEPLGLTSTVTLPEEAILQRAAVGHQAPPREAEPVTVWSLPRSLGPAGNIISTAHDILAFARLHLDGGVTPSGTRLLSGELVAAMREAQADIPSYQRGDAIGLGWRLNHWGDRWTFGHDGDTIGQSAYLRADPRSRVAACLLANSSVTEAAYEELFSEVFRECAGVTMPGGATPAAGPVEVDLRRHTGRYERASRRVEVYLRGQELRMTYITTGSLAELPGSEPEDLALYPASATGDSFVCRTQDTDPWTPVSFGSFGDKRPFVYVSGRVTPKVS
jgi:CubicO group peptidase (beta-lactamase class C family)